MKDKFILKDSGKRDEFKSGMVRDTRTGKGRFDLISPFALERIARIFEKGAIKYEDRNWEKGSSFSRTLDSAFRHVVQYMMGMKDEDHLAQAAWNLMAIMHLEQTMPHLDDMPHYLREKESKVKISEVIEATVTDKVHPLWEKVKTKEENETKSPDSHS